MNHSRQNHPVNYHVVIPAGGSGQRMQQGRNPGEFRTNPIAKQFLSLGDKTVLEHAVAPFLEDIDCLSIYIAVADTELENTKKLFDNSKVNIVRGGKNRSQSVLAGLNALNIPGNEESWVMVHDAARANLYSSDIQKLKTAVCDEPYGGILASPAKDTLKKVGESCVIETLDRQAVWHALTPQMFRLGKLFSAMNQAILEEVQLTDEASAMEFIGAKVILVEGRADNIKLTYAEDMLLMQTLIEHRK